MKNFNITLSILLLCTINSAFAARKTGTTAVQTKQQAPNKKPTRTPIVRQQPIIQEQPQEQPIKYDDILVFLKEKAPHSSDLPTLQNIKTEVERQINYIESLFARKIEPIQQQNLQQAVINQMKGDATRLVSKNIQEIINDLFPVQRGKKIAIIQTIAKNLIALNPNFEQSTGVDILYNAIMGNRKISQRFTTTPTSREIIRDTISTAWTMASF